MTYLDCARLLKQADNILLLTHKNPDGDTLCSAGALCSALRRLGKTVFMYPNSGIKGKFLPYVQEYIQQGEFQPDYIVSVDIATEGLFPAGFSGQVDLCIDHHPSNTHFGKQEFVKWEKSACGEIVFELIKNLCGRPTEDEATLLYIAITTDTGCFQYSNTNAATLAAAAELLRYGARNREVNLKFFRKISSGRIKLEGLIFSGLEFYRQGTVTVAIITKEMMSRAGATEDDCDDLAGLAGKAESSVVSITIKEQDDGSSKVSVRSNPEVNSCTICEAFGGGGHAMAAGCTISERPEKARDLLLAVVDEVFK